MKLDRKIFANAAGLFSLLVLLVLLELGDEPVENQPFPYIDRYAKDIAVNDSITPCELNLSRQ